jgi:hypothetical protein
MASAKFDFEYLGDKRILIATTRGFWTEETAHEYMAALTREMANVRRRSSRFALLSDARDFPVQSEAVMKILSAQNAAYEGVRKMAIVVSSTLNTMQAHRSFQSERIGVFKDMDEAFAWLDTGTKPA